MSPPPLPPHLLHPRHWPTWMAVGLLRALVLLPLPAVYGVGRALGRLYMRLDPRRQGIARTNLGLCFPELDEAAREALLRRHFESLGIGIMELGLGWWAGAWRLRHRVALEGLGRLREALAEGRGVILFSAHFTTLEIGGRFLALAAGDLPLRAMYRPNENPVLEHLIRRNRIRQFGPPIARDDVRGMLRALRRGEVVWYAADQNYGHKNSVFAPFFGIPAATNTATARLARTTGALVVPFFTRRLADGRYRQEIGAPLEGFPSDDPAADTARLNALIESWARQAPAQYFWLHRRFKDRPEGEPPLY